MLTIAAALTVANVVRLALYARRDELDIMQLVGAPQVYIRGPFVMEGILQGGTGALLALAALVGRVRRSCAPGISRRSRRPSTCRRSASCRSGCASLLVVGGMVVGCVGGLVAAWNRWHADPLWISL